MKQRLGVVESKGDCGCGCGGTENMSGCGDKSVNEEAVKVSMKTLMVQLLLQSKKESYQT